MNDPIRHRNITLRRLTLDLWQFIRAQSFIVKYAGRQFKRSQKYIEIDVTYRCNLKCINCNRSCTQLPSLAEMPVARIRQFVQYSIADDCQWERIRILGGEPTLHSQIHEIVQCLRDYKKRYNPTVRLVLGTNFFGAEVHKVLSGIPEDIHIKSTLKTSRANLFRPFNKAPIDSPFHYFSDFSSGCRIIEDCGIGLTPSGYYVCAVAGGIDRVFGFDLGRKRLPDKSDDMMDQLSVFCKYCGHFGFAWPVKRKKMSKTWIRGYANCSLQPEFEDTVPSPKTTPGSASTRSG